MGGGEQRNEKLKAAVMSVTMSDIKTASKKPSKKARVRSKKSLRREFTARDMNRSGAELLEAARRFGSVTIRSRAGDAFEVRSLKAAPTGPAAAKSVLERMRRHRERLAEIGYQEPSTEGWEVISQAIAGER